MLKADGVFEGGGVKCIALAGAACSIENHGYHWERLAGTSAGSILASLLAVGYNSSEVRKILYSLDFCSLLDKSYLSFLPIMGESLSVLFKKGIHSSDLIEKWLKNLLEAKRKTKFKDISINGISPLKIIATDITAKALLVLPDDLIKYDLDPMNFEISKAVQMSISIPFYFKPIELKFKNTSHFIVDGGVLSNFPIWIFDVEGTPRWPTFGFKLTDSQTSKTITKKNSFISFSLDLIHTLLDAGELGCPQNKDSARVLFIPTLGVKTTDFALSKTQSIALFNAGYMSGEKFMSTWNFEKYISLHRKKAL